MTNILTKSAEIKAFIARNCGQNHEQKWITIDTEFVREKTFYPELCLIQLATPMEAVIIDPLADGIDLTHFWEVMADENITKILHAAAQDLEIFYHLSPLPINNVFDTQIAAQALGYGESVGYDRLVEDVCHVKLDKSSRYTDWRLRPLSNEQIEYAAADVTWLCNIYEDFITRLTQNNRLHWIIEEIENTYTPKRFAPNPLEMWKRIKIRSPQPKQLVILQELAAWRDIEARERNIPRRHFIKDETLIDMAMLMPRDEKSLSKIRSISPKYAQGKHGKKFLELIDKALNRPRETWPAVKKIVKPSESVKTAVELLKTLLKVAAQNNQLTPHLIADNDDILALATLGKKADIACLKGWRYEAFGNDALKLLEGKTALAYNKGKIQLVPISFIH